MTDAINKLITEARLLADVVKKQSVVDSCHDWADDEQIHLDTEDCLRGIADALEAESARADELVAERNDYARVITELRILLDGAEEALASQKKHKESAFEAMRLAEKRELEALHLLDNVTADKNDVITRLSVANVELDALRAVAEAVRRYHLEHMFLPLDLLDAMKSLDAHDAKGQAK